MIALTTQLITQLLGVAVPAWLSCEPVQILCGLLIFGYIVRIFVGLVKSHA